MPHILMIATGGTIACCETERGLSPALDGTALLGALPELSALCTVETLDLPFLYRRIIETIIRYDFIKCKTSIVMKSLSRQAGNDESH